MGILPGSDTCSDRSDKLHDTSSLCNDIHFPWLFFYVFLAEPPVRGMMYYRETLELQCFLDFADDNGWWIPLLFTTQYRN